MNQKEFKIINKIGMLLLLATIVTFNIIIGANEKGLRVLPISILMGLMVVYLIILKFNNKNESIVFKGKIDYFVLGFMITTTLPLIFKTWASYSDTVEFIMKYFFIYSVYLLARNVIKDKKQIEYIIVTTLICSLFSIILHFNYINGHFFKSFIRWLNITYAIGNEFCGTFGYPNAQAIYMAFCIFLAMHRFTYNKKIVLKVIDVIYILFAMYIIWIADAKAIMLLLAIVLFILLIVKSRKEIVKHRIIVLVGIVILLIPILVFLFIALNTSKPITSREKETTQKIMYHFKQNQKYTLELELTTIYLDDLADFKDSSFIIKVYDEGEYFFSNKLASETFGDFNGKYKIEFTPTRDIDYIKLIIVNQYIGVVAYNKCYINGEEQIINYKYIPNELAYILRGYSISEKSLLQRLYMWQDCLTIAKDSPIVGSGGNAWKNVSLAVAQYKGALKESHSYFFELLISYGIIGVVAFLNLIIFFFVKILKQCIKDKEVRKQKLLISLGLFILLIHSITFDFNMSFMLIQLVVYIFIAVLLYDEQELKNTKVKYIDYIVIILLIFILSIYIRADISNYLLNDNSSKHNVTPYKKSYYNNMINDDIENNVTGKEILNELKSYMKKELYYTQTEDYERYFSLIYQNIDNLSNKELEDYLNFGIERLKTVKVKSPMYIESVIERTEILVNTIKNLEAYLTEIDVNNEERLLILNNTIQELKDIVNIEYETNIKHLGEQHRIGYSDEQREDMKNIYQKIVDSIE